MVRSGSWFHTMNRGLQGASLFPTGEAAAAFVDGIGEVAGRYAVEVNAYCVMGNHYHLLVRADEHDLLQAVAFLEAGIAGNAGRARLRRLAMGRHLLQVTRYIHRNPVEARLCRRPAEWPWSSFHGYVNPLESPRWLRCDAVLGWLGPFGARQRYRQYVEGVSQNWTKSWT